jgi:hypothetical protein
MYLCMYACIEIMHASALMICTDSLTHYSEFHRNKERSKTWAADSFFIRRNWKDESKFENFSPLSEARPSSQVFVCSKCLKHTKTLESSSSISFSTFNLQIFRGVLLSMLLLSVIM